MSELTLYSRSDFHNDLDTDLWVLEKFDWLPENPPPIIDEKEGEVRIQLFDDFSLEAKQEAIKRYRKHLTPVIFTLTQKIYAELFRLVLGQSNCPSIKKDVPRQVDVEEIIEIILGQRVNPPYSKQISKLSSSFPSSLKFQPVFDNKAEFINWWQGRYNYSQLRHARNQIIHDKYNFSNDNLEIFDGTNNLILSWNADQIHSFANEVRSQAYKI